METLTMLQQLGEGMVVSVEIFLLTLLFALPLGLIVSFGRMSKIRTSFDGIYGGQLLKYGFNPRKLPELTFCSSSSLGIS